MEIGRLIEAETLKASVRAKFPNVADRCEINELINAAPTVDAIPVAWLESMQQESLNENDRNMVGAIEAIFIEWHIYVNQLREKNRQKEQEANTDA